MEAVNRENLIREAQFRFLNIYCARKKFDIDCKNNPNLKKALNNCIKQITNYIKDFVFTNEYINREFSSDIASNPKLFNELNRVFNFASKQLFIIFFEMFISEAIEYEINKHIIDVIKDRVISNCVSNQFLEIDKEIQNKLRDKVDYKAMDKFYIKRQTINKILNKIINDCNRYVVFLYKAIYKKYNIMPWILLLNGDFFHQFEQFGHINKLSNDNIIKLLVPGVLPIFIENEYLKIYYRNIKEDNFDHCEYEYNLFLDTSSISTIDEYNKCLEEALHWLDSKLYNKENVDNSPKYIVQKDSATIMISMNIEKLKYDIRAKFCSLKAHDRSHECKKGKNSPPRSSNCFNIKITRSKINYFLNDGKIFLEKEYANEKNNSKFINHDTCGINNSNLTDPRTEVCSTNNCKYSQSDISKSDKFLQNIVEMLRDIIKDTIYNEIVILENKLFKTKMTPSMLQSFSKCPNKFEPYRRWLGLYLYELVDKKQFDRKTAIKFFYDIIMIENKNDVISIKSRYNIDNNQYYDSKTIIDKFIIEWKSNEQNKNKSIKEIKNKKRVLRQEFDNAFMSVQEGMLCGYKKKNKGNRDQSLKTLEQS